MKSTALIICLFWAACVANVFAFKSYPKRPDRTVTEVTLPSIFNDHMVMQRDQKVRVWGWAKANVDVSVTFGGQTKTTKADQKGAWSVMLDPMKACSDGRDLKVSCTGKKLVIKDVLVGEVWLCSGQSNMVFKLGNSVEGALELGCADFDALRFTKLPEVASPTPKADYPLDQGKTGRWILCKGADASDCSAVAYYFGLRLHRFLKVPVGLIDASWGGTMAQHWVGKDRLINISEMKPYIEEFAKKQKEWDVGGGLEGAKKRLDVANKAYAVELKNLKEGERRPGKPKLQKDPNLGRQPAGMVNSMIAPLSGYTLKGVLFYQGENNAFGDSWKPYKKTLPEVINTFRQAFDNKELPFGIIQIHGWSTRRSMEYDQNHHCNVIREIQFDTWRRTPNTGLIVSFDCNTNGSIHPNLKRPIGERSARWALTEAYQEKNGRSSLDWKGPIYTKMEIQGNKVVLHFETRTLNLNKGVDVGFYIAGEDRKFHHAHARVVGKTVEVWKEGLEKPVAVRYAISNLPIGELMGASNMPAYPLRTDNWPITPHQSTGSYIRNDKNNK